MHFHSPLLKFSYRSNCQPINFGWLLSFVYSERRSHSPTTMDEQNDAVVGGEMEQEAPVEATEGEEGAAAAPEETGEEAA